MTIVAELCEAKTAKSVKKNTLLSNAQVQYLIQGVGTENLTPQALVIIYNRLCLKDAE